MSIKKLALGATVVLCAVLACKSKKSDSNADPKDKLMGVWKEEKAQGANFVIKPDSIYYTENKVLSVYKYTLAKDSIKIFFDNYTYNAKVYFTKDKMIMDSPVGGIATYQRIRN